jgi:hypothetical protein
MACACARFGDPERVARPEDLISAIRMFMAEVGDLPAPAVGNYANALGFDVPLVEAKGG